jgi:hypothetical protein
MDDCGFRTGIDHFRGIAVVRCDRGDVDYRPALALRHPRGDRPTHQHGSEQVAINDCARVIELERHGSVRVRLCTARADIAACAIDQNGNGSELEVDGLGHTLDRNFIRDVTRDRETASNGRQNGQRRRTQCRRLAVLSRSRVRDIVDCERGAEVGEVLCDGPTQPSTGAGYQRHLAG